MVPPSDRPLVPDFHESDKKLESFVAQDLRNGDYSDRCMRFLAELIGAPLAGLRILDIGCGRGELVWRLREGGARAFGVEIEPRYLESGAILNTTFRDELPVLALAEGNGRFPFPEASFDLVVSFQVLEHVSDLEVLAVEVARVLRPGGMTVHVFPAKYRVIEPHYALPFVHWLPKSPIRKLAISAMLAVGLARGVLPDHGRRARAASIYAYSNAQTFYRSPWVIATTFASAGLVRHRGHAVVALIRSRVPKLPLIRVLALAVNLLRTTVVAARKPFAECN